MYGTKGKEIFVFLLIFHTLCLVFLRGLKEKFFFFSVFRYLSHQKVQSFFFFNFYLFIYGCVVSSFLCEGFLWLWQAGATLHRGARGLSLVWQAGATLHRGARASHCHGLSCCGAQAPDAQAQ